jgi:TolA-binding protein
MTRSTNHRRLETALWLAAALLVGVLAPPASAGDEAKATAKNEAPATLGDIGAEFESALLRGAADRRAALEDVSGSLESMLKRGVPNNRRNAARFLWGEVRFALDDYKAAAQAFRETADKGKKEPFADDAAFAEVIAIEAQGRDGEAVKAWAHWEKDFPESPLMGEALLARAWNALRRDTLQEASAYLDQIGQKYPHMTASSRFVIADATLAYLQGRTVEALEALKDQDGAPAIYLRALCYAAKGDMLKAAAQFQSVAERFPDSALRDYAMLAKANVFLASGAYKTAAEEFESVASRAARPDVVAEAELQHAASVYLDNQREAGAELLHEITTTRRGSDVAARAQLLLGEALFGQERYEEAILEFNRVLTDYFEHELAASAQYSVGRCLDALGRYNEATSAYQLVVSGYPQSPQAPAAAYLAGVGLLQENRPQAAVPYFQLVLDRYARDKGEGTIVFASPGHQELVEAALCLLELSYHRTGDMGQLSGVPHLMLQKMPPSASPWRAYALLIDADALAAQGRYEESQTALETLMREFPEHEVAIPATRLLAWTYARQGNDEMAIQTEERMLARYAGDRDTESLSSAYLNKAHILFNRKQYKEAAETYDDFLNRFPEHPKRLLALYQAGLCHYRLQHTGDAVDRWEELVSIDPSAEIAERAWVRAGDVYFQAEHYDDAKRCYQGLLDNFKESRGAALGTLRMAQCDYNAGRDADALAAFSDVVQRFPGTGVAVEAEKGMERALYRLGQQKDGAEVLARLVEQFPTSPFAADAQFEIAMRCYEAKDYAKAADAFRRVVSQFPGYSAADRAHYLMADSYAQAGDAEKARLAYEQFIMFFPESEFNTTVRFRLASSRFDEGDYMRAAIDFTTVMEHETSKDIASASQFNLALCRQMLGQSEEALAALRKYRETYPGDERAAQVAYHIGDTYEKTGRAEEAIEEYKTALASNPGDLTSELHYRIGTCREQLGDETGALAAYQKATATGDKTDPFRLSAVARCASLHEKNGDYKAALADYRDLIRNAKDPELVVAAKERAAQLEAASK